jgi:hypothetical protein
MADTGADADSMVAARSTAAGRDSMAAAASDLIEDSAAAPWWAAADFTVSRRRAAVAGSTAVEDSTAVAVADSAGEAIGSRWKILLSQLNGWRLMLPAVFLLPLFWLVSRGIDPLSR